MPSPARRTVSVKRSRLDPYQEELVDWVGQGLTFREMARRLLKRGVRVRVFDPVVREGAPGVPKGVTFADDAYDAAKGAHALALVTEWNEFRRLDLARVRRVMRRRVLVDLRNVYEPAAVRRLGFEYTCVGRPT